jgi:transposase-like protein
MIGRKHKRFTPSSKLDAGVLLFRKEPIIMNKKIYRKDEQIKLIMECRQSGLSDYQWCARNDINPGTFYNWVSKLHKSGYTFSDSSNKSNAIAVTQEVVKVDMVSIQNTSVPW